MNSTRFREARAYLGFTQAEVATFLRIPESTLRAIEDGAGHVIPELMESFERLYQRPERYLLGLPDAPPLAGNLSIETEDLSEHDKGEVIAFARYLRHRAEIRDRADA